MHEHGDAMPGGQFGVGTQPPVPARKVRHADARALRDCSVELDGTKVVDRGRLSAELA